MRRRRTDSQARVNSNLVLEFGDVHLTSYAGSESVPALSAHDAVQVLWLKPVAFAIAVGEGEALVRDRERALG